MHNMLMIAVRLDHRHPRSTTRHRISFHFGHRRLPPTNHQSLHCHRKLLIMLLNIPKPHSPEYTGPVLVAMEEARPGASIQR